MDNVEQLITIDWWYVVLAILALLAAVKGVWSLLDWLFVEKLGIKTKKMRQREQESQKLKTFAELATTTAENLDKLQKRHCKDEEEFRNNLNNYMAESREDRKVLHDEMTVYSNNRINDRKQSLEIQKELTDSQNKLTDSQNKLTEKVDDICKKLIDMEEKENKRVQSEIKERIAQSYRQYNETKQISSMELEALEDLIETYEAHGGENSFVHSVVQKEMYTWEVK